TQGSGESPGRVGCALDAVEVQVDHRWPVVNREQDRIRAAGVLMPVPAPGRYRENIPWAPFEPAFANRRSAFTAEHRVDRAAIVPMSSRPQSGHKKLDLARK